MRAPLIRIGSPAAALFASDMHLDAERPALTTRFLEDLDRQLARATAAGEAPALFLLGDLFEFWVGDDHPAEPALAVAAGLASFVAAGGRVWLMHGNRDFLIDAPLPGDPQRRHRYSVRCGASMLVEPAILEVGGRRIGLCHGDALCTDDSRYQQWRAVCRDPAWQQALLARPVAERIAMALALRQQSMASQSDARAGGATMEALGDVSAAAVDALMTGLGTDLLIHGHTHRPALHAWTADGRRRQRWVLSDWETSPARGSIRSLAEIHGTDEGRPE